MRVTSPERTQGPALYDPQASLKFRVHRHGARDMRVTSAKRTQALPSATQASLNFRVHRHGARDMRVTSAKRTQALLSAIPKLL